MITYLCLTTSYSFYINLSVIDLYNWASASFLNSFSILAKCAYWMLGVSLYEVCRQESVFSCLILWMGWLLNSWYLWDYRFMSSFLCFLSHSSFVLKSAFDKKLIRLSWNKFHINANIIEKPKIILKVLIFQPRTLEGSCTSL